MYYDYLLQILIVQYELKLGIMWIARIDIAELVNHLQYIIIALN